MKTEGDIITASMFKQEAMFEEYKNPTIAEQMDDQA